MREKKDDVPANERQRFADPDLIFRLILVGFAALWLAYPPEAAGRSDTGVAGLERQAERR